MKEGGRGSGSGAFKHYLRSALVFTEVALAFLLVTGSGLLIRSFLKCKTWISLLFAALLSFMKVLLERAVARQIHSRQLFFYAGVLPVSRESFLEGLALYEIRPIRATAS
jgi:hypothetical protein